MKKGLLYLLLIIYAFSIVKPTLPFIYNAVSHAFFYQHHIATVHKVNGKLHVHHEFIKESKKENSRNNSADFKKLIPADEHLFLPFYSVLPVFVFIAKMHSHKVFNLTWRPVKGNFPPPKQTVAYLFI